jgi:DNA-binding MarR family transcriptional regulator
MAVAPKPPAGPEDWQLEFVDRLGSFSEVSGVAPSVLRILGWLMVCEPAEQPVDDLRAALGLSAGAVSMGLNTLAHIGYIERRARPGERRRYYRLHPDAWERATRIRLESLVQGRAAVERALAAGGRPNPRLEGMLDLYAFFERSVAEYLVRLPRR